MSTDDLTQNEILVLLVLMSENRAVRNAELKALGPELKAGERTRLEKRELIAVTRPTRYIELELTAPGWEYCTALFGSEAPEGINPATRVVFTMMRSLERFMARRDLVAGQVFQPPLPAALVSDPGVTVARRIREAYSTLASRRGGWVGLTELRAELHDVSRRDLDAALVELQEQPGVSLIPEENQKTLTDADRDAAVLVGTQPSHLLSIEAGR